MTEIRLAHLRDCASRLDRERGRPVEGGIRGLQPVVILTQRELPACFPVAELAERDLRFQMTSPRRLVPGFRGQPQALDRVRDTVAGECGLPDLELGFMGSP